MQGKTREELAGLTPDALEDALGGLPSASKHVAILCVDGVKKLLGVS
jgi:hypothetical protein